MHPCEATPGALESQARTPVGARKEDYRQRYKVERSFAWLVTFRPLLIRWEYLFSVYRSWFTVAVLLLCLRRVGNGA